MKIIAVNGGPRANHNTAQLLESAIEGARSEGADVERFDLYKMDYKGCRGCFACKRKGSKSLFSCGIRDGLTPLLEAVAGADALLRLLEGRAYAQVAIKELAAISNTVLLKPLCDPRREPWQAGKIRLMNCT